MARIRPGRGRARLALLLRLLGSTGAFVALLGLIPLASALDLSSYDSLQSAAGEFVNELPQPSFTNFYRDVGLSMVLGGGAVFLICGLLLTVAGVGNLVGSRNVAAANATFQTVLAVALLIAVNVFSFNHY